MQEYQRKSLTDVILENCVFNFKEIFFEKGDDDRKLTLKKNIALPPYLFERIQYKSREIGWFISYKFLISCLRFREELNWQSIDLQYLRFTNLYGGDCKIIAMSEFPVTKLVFYCFNITETMMLYLSRIAHNLKHLVIQQRYDIDDEYEDFNFRENCENEEINENDIEPIKRLHENKIKFPNLETLCLEFVYNDSLDFVDMIDLSSFSDSLRILKLEYFGTYHLRPELHKSQHPIYSMKLIDTIKNCKNLVKLSLRYSYFEQMDMLFDAVGSLKELRSLNIAYLCNKDYVRFVPKDIELNVDLSKLISNLPKLEYLDIHNCTLPWKETKILKRLKYIHISNITLLNTIPVEAKEIGCDGSLNGLLSILTHFEDISHISYFSSYLYELAKNAITLTDDQCNRAKRAIIKAFDSFSDIFEDNRFQDILKLANLYLGDNLFTRLRRTFYSMYGHDFFYKNKWNRKEMWDNVFLSETGSVIWRSYGNDVDDD